MESQPGNPARESMAPGDDPVTNDAVAVVHRATLHVEMVLMTEARWREWLESVRECVTGVSEDAIK